MSNEIIKKYLDDGSLCHCSISFDFPIEGSPLDGMKLTGGYIVEHGGEKYVRFGQKLKGQNINVRYGAQRPELTELVKEYEAAREEMSTAMQAGYEAQRAEQEALDRPYLDAMEAKAAQLREQIPADHIEVTASKTGDSDGWPILSYEVDGVKLKWDEVNTIGTACAVRPGAMGAFAQVWIASIPKDKLEEIRKRNQESTEKKAVEKEAYRKALAEADIPQHAINSYNRFKGDADKAWEDEDESAWADIKKWAPYIEAQRGMHPDKLRQITIEAGREVNYGIND